MQSMEYLRTPWEHRWSTSHLLVGALAALHDASKVLPIQPLAAGAAPRGTVEEGGDPVLLVISPFLLSEVLIRLYHPGFTLLQQKGGATVRNIETTSLHAHPGSNPIPTTFSGATFGASGTRSFGSKTSPCQGAHSSDAWRSQRRPTSVERSIRRSGDASRATPTYLQRLSDLIGPYRGTYI